MALLRFGRASYSSLLAAALVLVAGGGCASSPTSLLLTLQLDGTSPQPSSLTVSVYDVHRRLTVGTVAPVKLPGTLIIDSLPNSSQTLRVAVDGASASPSPDVDDEEAGAIVATASGSQTSATLTLAESTADQDGDGVPDLIDNCPTVANDDQADKLGNGVGDACRGGDGGAPDLSISDLAGLDLRAPVDLAPPADLLLADLATPPVLTCHSLFCDDFESGSYDSSWTFRPDDHNQGTIAVDSIHAYSGRYAFHMHANAGATSYLQLQLENTQGMSTTGAFMRFWVYQNANPPTNTLLFLAEQDNHDPYGQAGIDIEGQVLTLGTGGLIPNVPEVDGTALPLGRWVCVEWQLEVNPDPADGGLIPNGMTMWITDPKLSPSPGPAVTTDGPHAPYGLQEWGPAVGYSPPKTAPAWDVWYDAIAIDNKRIGCN